MKKLLLPSHQSSPSDKRDILVHEQKLLNYLATPHPPDFQFCPPSICRARATSLFSSFGTGGEVFSMILEALSGDLCDFKSSRSSRPPSEVELAGMFGQLLIGLEYCHRNRVVHRDIKVGGPVPSGPVPSGRRTRAIGKIIVG